MEIGDKVKVTGTRITGVITEIYSDRNKGVFNTFSKILLVKVKHDNSDIEMEYIVNELRKIESDG